MNIFSSSGGGGGWGAGLIEKSENPVQIIRRADRLYTVGHDKMFDIEVAYKAMTGDK